MAGSARLVSPEGAPLRLRELQKKREERISAARGKGGKTDWGEEGRLDSLWWGSHRK